MLRWYGDTVIRRAEKVDYIPEKVAIIYSHLAHFVQVYKDFRIKMYYFQ